MTYNVHRWGDDRSALSSVIRTCDPEVLIVQEAPTWYGTRSRRRAFARSVDLNYLAGEARTAAFVTTPAHWTIRTRRIWRPLVRRWKSACTLQLPGGAIALSTKINKVGRFNNVSLSVVGCHLGLSNRGRLAEMEQVLDLVRRSAGPSVLVGDINEPADGPVWKLAEAAGLIDPEADHPKPTFPAAAPRSRIDIVWTSPGIRALPVDLGCLGLDQQLLARASDHLPLVVDLLTG
ncbi:endonuclease/exonuclease/phosphatase family protein [Microlunatus elymi]|nr:endonuclease/exonuclease/phosphatase family protein [Microlunatus elymi]